MPLTDKEIDEMFLNKPYTRIITPDEYQGIYTAEILEFQGCVDQGTTPQEAYDNLNNTARGWIRASLDLGHEIPKPFHGDPDMMTAVIQMSAKLQFLVQEAAKLSNRVTEQLMLDAIIAEVDNVINCERDKKRTRPYSYKRGNKTITVKAHLRKKADSAYD